MKKLLGICIALICLIGTNLYAKDVKWQLVIDSVTVSGTDSIYSSPLLIGDYSDFSFCFTTHDSTATVDVDLFVQVIDSNQSNYSIVGSTNDASVDPNFDVTYSSNNYTGTWVTIATAGTLITAQGNDTKVIDGFSLPVTRLFRFKVEGSGSNNVSRTIVSLTLGRYKER